MKNVPFLIIAVILVGIIGCSMVLTVKGQSTGAGVNADKEAYYRQMEEQLLQETKTYLSDRGFVNSGVTLNRIVDANGKREYTFTIHHSRIDKMDGAEKYDLQTELLERGVAAEKEAFAECSFRYEFLIL